MKIIKRNFIIIIVYIIIVNIFTNKMYGTKEKRIEELKYIKEIVKKYILSYYYWKKIFLNKEEGEGFFPYEVSLKIEIKKENRGKEIIYYCVVGNGVGRKEKMIYKVVKRKGNVIMIKDYFNDMGKKWGEIERGEGDIWDGTIILPSNWEPEYGEVKGKKKEMVEKIKRLVKRYFLRFVIKKDEDIKKIMNKKIIIYIRDFYLWEEGSEIIIISNERRFLGNLSFYDAIEGKFIEGEYDEISCLIPTKWKFPRGFRLEGYRGRDEYLRKFAKHYIREEIEIRKEDIERWERRNEKR